MKKWSKERKRKHSEFIKSVNYKRAGEKRGFLFNNNRYKLTLWLLNNKKDHFYREELTSIGINLTTWTIVLKKEYIKYKFINSQTNAGGKNKITINKEEIKSKLYSEFIKFIHDEILTKIKKEISQLLSQSVKYQSKHNQLLIKPQKKRTNYTALSEVYAFFYALNKYIESSSKNPKANIIINEIMESVNKIKYMNSNQDLTEIQKRIKNLCEKLYSLRDTNYKENEKLLENSLETTTFQSKVNILYESILKGWIENIKTINYLQFGGLFFNIFYQSQRITKDKNLHNIYLNMINIMGEQYSDKTIRDQIYKKQFIGYFADENTIIYTEEIKKLYEIAGLYNLLITQKKEDEKK
jgi:hypothetical protein